MEPTSTAICVRPPPPASSTLAAVSSLFACVGEAQAWTAACHFGLESFRADAAAGLVLVSPHRASFSAAVGLVSVGDGTFPIAPDSQAAAVLRSSTTVSSWDLAAETRFIPAPMLLANGLRSSLTCRVEVGPDQWGVIGVYAKQIAAFDADDHAAFDVFADVVATAIRQVRARAELEDDARHDALTGLLSRPAVLGHLQQQIDRNIPSLALLIDLDGFKSVNDRHGHGVGDLVLQRVARRIDRAIGSEAVCGRLGGDEFMVVIEERGAAEVSRLADRILAGIEEIVFVDEVTAQVSASIGIARTADRSDALVVTRVADQMMYQAKTLGRGHVRRERPPLIGPQVSTPVVPDTTSCAVPDVASVDEAIAGLRVLFQPIVDAATGDTVGLEALTRGPVGHPLEFPDVLFPTAVTVGRLAELELEAKRLAFAADLPAGLALYVNLEPSVLSSPGWLDQLVGHWRVHAPDRLIVAELTERAVLAAPGRLMAAVQACRSVGWRIALDDVGSRSESLAALRWVQPDVVKLDIELIHGDNRAHAAHVSTTIEGFRQRRTIQVVAEGVETGRDVDRARVLGADHLQGFLYARPAAAQDLDLDEVRRRHHSIALGSDSSGERRATKHELLAISRHIESIALTSDAVVLAALQRPEFLTQRTRRQYRALARRCGFVGLLGIGLRDADSHGIAGVRLADLDIDDPLAQAWHVVLLSPTQSLALVATEVDPPDAGGVPDMDRIFRYRLTTDPGEVEQAANDLLVRF